MRRSRWDEDSDWRRSTLLTRQVFALLLLAKMVLNTRIHNYGFALALPQISIWYKKNWTTTLKSVFDGLIYALLIGGVFGWLWPA